MFHVLSLLVYGVVNSVCIRLRGSANGLWTNPLSMGCFRAKSKSGAANKNRTQVRSTKKAVSRHNSAKQRLQRESSAPSDTAGLSANIQTSVLTSPGSGGPILSRTTPAKDTRQIQSRLDPAGPPKVTESSPEKFSGKYDHLEIWVSHSAHEFKLYGLAPKGDKESYTRRG